MTTIDPPMTAGRRPGVREGAIGWLTTTDHKKIGVLYMASAFIFFLVAGLFALLLRAELAAPGLQVMGLDTYNQLFTMHGTAMLFFFATPMGPSPG